MTVKHIRIVDMTDQEGELWVNTAAIELIHKYSGQEETIVVTAGGTKIYTKQTPQDLLRAIAEATA